MLTKDIVQEQLKYVYEANNRTYEHRQSTKKWAITVWAAIIIGILSEKIELPLTSGILITAGVLAGFWLYEWMSGVYWIFTEKQAEKLERLITSGNYDVKNPNHYMYIQGYKQLGFLEKVKAYIYALLRLESVFVFVFAFFHNFQIKTITWPIHLIKKAARPISILTDVSNDHAYISSGNFQRCSKIIATSQILLR